MKLIEKTFLYTAIWLLPVMIIGSIYCFFMIEYIAYEETDEYLTYEMDRLKNFHKQHNALHEFHKTANLIPNKRYEKPFFKDTMLLEPGDNEMVPYRELHFSIKHEEQNYGVILRHLLPGRDDIVQGTFFIVIGLMLLIAIIIILIINLITGKIWKPFYGTLNKLINFKIDSPLPTFPVTSIKEFKALNGTLLSLLKKISDDYRNNKEFNENASHELQTHLAVIRANAEKLLNISYSNHTIGINELDKIYTASTHLSQIQKSLLLLSKINNREFSKSTKVDLCKIITLSLETFSEAAQLRDISIQTHINPVIIEMDIGLAEILINNLIKNAVKYNVQNGFLSILLNNSSLVVKNSGQPFRGDPNKLIERFARGENGNLGIGLAMVKQICEIYHFTLNYSVSDTYDHILTVYFQPAFNPF
ncbi:MAG TPA: HAMP domain-containing sensor histidine kinase [Chitinispirillaceae bacterium]|nr:HAMP domain-containing sensor histidine kinase [Chitinispirillaceae bacterium]